MSQVNGRSNQTVSMSIFNSFYVLLALSLVGVNELHAQPKSEDQTVLKNESEIAVVITAGNSSAETLSFKQANSLSWKKQNTLKLSSHFLRTVASDVESAKSWSFGLRYERAFGDRFGIYIGPSIIGNLYSGYLQRYDFDLGGKYFAFKKDAFTWFFEAGYRYSIENRTDFTQVNSSYIRLYTELNKVWNKGFSTKWFLEFLPNLSQSGDNQINTELSAKAAISSVFSIKVAYLLKFRSILVGDATKNTDSQFTTALTASF